MNNNTITKLLLGSCLTAGMFNVSAAANDVPNSLRLLDKNIIENLAAQTDEILYHSFEVPEGTTRAIFRTRHGSGNADLFVKFGSEPTTEDFDFSSTRRRSKEGIVIDDPQVGTYYIGIKATSAFEGLTLKAKAKTDIPVVLENNVTQTKLRRATDRSLTFTFEVPENVAELSFVTENGRGNADLYVKLAEPATVENADYASTGSDNNEVITIAEETVQAGTYHVTLLAQEKYKKVDLTASYTLLPPVPEPEPIPRQANGVMMQYFNWYTPNDGSLWTQVAAEAENLANAGISALWLPPAYKGASGGYDVGYGVYDMYDLGEFDQKGSVRTKYGTKDEYLNAIDQAHNNGIQIYGDVVFNHRGGADATESVTAVRVDWNDRNIEQGEDVQIDAWTQFDFAARDNKYSDFKWRWYHFDGVDWAQNLAENSIFKFRGIGKAWDWEVATENGNYDYLMFADLDMDHPEVVQELKDWGQWYVDFTQVDGFRIDAIKHIKYDFFNEWLDFMRNNSNKELFAVGEYWSYDKEQLHNYITKTEGRMSLFDAPLHLNFHQASTWGGHYDMSTIMDNTLMKEQPSLAVTLVDNHDTQPCQALESPVADWFKPMAYAFILLREEGYPNIFHADYYGANYTTSDNGCDNTEITIASQKAKIDTLLQARKNYAYGTQISYLDHHDIIGWTRLGDEEHVEAMAVILTDGPGGSKWMDVARVNTVFIDITGNRPDTVVSNADGWAEFPVNGGSYSVWVEQVGVEPPPVEEPADSIMVTLNCANGETYFGQNVYAVGNIDALGNWNPANAMLLSADNYPLWSGQLELAPATTVEWKCIKVEGQNVEWQSGNNNSFTTPNSGDVITQGSF